MSKCGSLGCAADKPCAPCAARMAGTTVRVSPDVQKIAAAANIVGDIFGIPEPLRAGLNTAVGIGTPVSAQDAQDFARLVTTWAEIDAALFDPSTAGSLKSQIAAARKNWSSFERLWNAAQRDPAKLREQLAIADQLLAAIQASKTPENVIQEKAASLPKAVVYTAVGGLALGVGGVLVLIFGRK